MVCLNHEKIENVVFANAVVFCIAEFIIKYIDQDYYVNILGDMAS